MGMWCRSLSGLVKLFLIAFLIQIPSLQAALYDPSQRITPNQPHKAVTPVACPNGDADCDLCAGEICFQGECTFWATDPCPLDCSTCEQNGDSTTCIANDDYCQDLVGECRDAQCNLTLDKFNHPTGCEYTYNPDDAVCQECNQCGNGICEFPEDTDQCPQDCLEPGKDPGLPKDPPKTCGPIDYPGVVLGCNDGDYCTEDICGTASATLALVNTCEYKPKSCSGDTQDFCCPQGCSGDPQSGNAYDIDCCTPEPSPSPSPVPTPVPSASPNPNDDIPPENQPMMWFQGSGCSLVRPVENPLPLHLLQPDKN